jgi:hypothetical protein
MNLSQEAPERTICKGCKGSAEFRERGALPVGWYAMTVAVPSDWTTRTGKPYVWVGIFCSLACVREALPGLREQEALARQAYTAVRAS